MRDDEITLVDGRQVVDVISDLVFHNLTVGTFQKTVIIGSGIGSQRVNQSDVRAFRRFNRTHATVVGRMHVPHFKTCPLAGQAAWAKR